MNLRLLAAMISFLSMLAYVPTVFSQQVQTINQAIDKVKAITNPDTAVQNALRAREAFNIIVNRIRNINSIENAEDLPQYETLGRELTYLRGEMARPGQPKGIPAPSAEILKWVWENRVARCAEKVNLMKIILQGAGVPVTQLTSTAGHAILVVNVAPNADFDNPWAWGPNAEAPDTWLGRVLKPEEAWLNKWYFANGKALVYSGGGKMGSNTTTREWLKHYNQKGLPFIKAHCEQYRQMLNSYFKIPAKYRKALDFRPEEDIKLDEWEKTYQEINKAFNDKVAAARELIKAHNEKDGHLMFLKAQAKVAVDLSILQEEYERYQACSDQVKEFDKKCKALLAKVTKEVAYTGDPSELIDEGPEGIPPKTEKTKDAEHGQMPAGFTVWHKRALLWPTKMNLVKQQGTTGSYRGADFQGNACEGTMQFQSGGNVYINIKCSHGYVGNYYGKRQGNVVEGEYHPSAGFGPVEYFKASW